MCTWWHSLARPRLLGIQDSPEHLHLSSQRSRVFQVIKPDADLTCTKYATWVAHPFVSVTGMQTSCKLENLHRLRAHYVPDWEPLSSGAKLLWGHKVTLRNSRSTCCWHHRACQEGMFASRQWERLERSAPGICTNSALAFTRFAVERFVFKN